MNVLFTSSGRRVELINIFKIEGFKTFAADSDPTAPSLYVVSKGFIVPRVVDSPLKYVETLLSICKKESIDIVIPLIDPELVILARAKDEFLDIGTTILLSSYSSVEISADKYKTYNFYKKTGLLAPKTINLDDREQLRKEIKENFFPAILKPKYGSAGKGILECRNLHYFNFFSSHQNCINYILQKYVSGEEITIDIFGDGTGHLISAVQRKRLKVRGGEVERGITVKYPKLFEDALKFAKEFKPFGPVNIQCFYDKGTNNGLYTEINARFGGGFPLSYHAGANFPKYIKSILSGKILDSMVSDDYKEGLVMSRFDNAVYKYKEELLNLDKNFI